MTLEIVRFRNTISCPAFLSGGDDNFIVTQSQDLDDSAHLATLMMEKLQLCSPVKVCTVLSVSEGIIWNEKKAL
jgi:hypothetical protein